MLTIAGTSHHNQRRKMAGRHMLLLVALCLTTLISYGVDAAPSPTELNTAKDANNHNDSYGSLQKTATEADNQKKGSMEEHPRSFANKAEMKCLGGWTEWKGACYFFDPNSQKTWYEGRIDCVRKSLGQGDLVSIHSKQENSLVYLLADGADAWIGFYVDPIIHKEEYFKWSDNTPRRYTNWLTNPQQPSNRNGNEDCTQLQGTYDGNWFDRVCTQARPYVCKAPRVMMYSEIVV